jgi:hypothetical protein
MIIFSKISPGPSFPKRGIPPFDKGRERGILSHMPVYIGTDA